MIRDSHREASDFSVGQPVTGSAADSALEKYEGDAEG